MRLKLPHPSSTEGLLRTRVHEMAIEDIAMAKVKEMAISQELAIGHEMAIGQELSIGHEMCI